MYNLKPARHFYHKKLDEERFILFYYESFRFASFCRGGEVAEIGEITVRTAVHL